MSFDGFLDFDEMKTYKILRNALNDLPIAQAKELYVKLHFYKFSLTSMQA